MGLSGWGTSKHAVPTRHGSPVVTGAWLQWKRLGPRIPNNCCNSRIKPEERRAEATRAVPPLHASIGTQAVSQIVKLHLKCLPTACPQDGHGTSFVWECELVTIFYFYLFITSWHTFLLKSIFFFPCAYWLQWYFQPACALLALTSSFFSYKMNSHFPGSTSLALSQLKFTFLNMGDNIYA